MSGLPRPLPAFVLPLLWLFAACAAPPPPGMATADPDPHQIEWQRSLDDALALAAAERRPLLIALNMDGESASDRIVRENYRDPAFVAATRKCVCVAGSVFRHNPRDHDDRGRRIPCPRLGGVTCGEHLAIEPALFEKLMADGERVAPRHALVSPDGRKAFDLALCFDLMDVDRALFAAVKDLPERVVPDPSSSSWADLAARRDHSGRAALEACFLVADETATAAALAAIGQAGDRGALDTLRLAGRQAPAGNPLAGAFYHDPALAPAVLGPLLAAARTIGVAAELASWWREWLETMPRRDDHPPSQARSWVDDDDCGLSGALARLDGSGAATRSLLLAHSVLVPDAAAAAAALRAALPDVDAAAVDAARAAAGGAIDLGRELGNTPAEVIVAPTGAEMPGADELDRALGELDAVPAAQRDAGWHARFAKASLDLGRRHLEGGQQDAPLLLEDAELHWQKALAATPDRADWWIERARTAHFLGRFAEQVAHGERACAEVQPPYRAGDPLTDPLAIEALRWVGDGNARLLVARQPGDAAAELRAIHAALRSLARVAATARGTAKDWLSLASCCGVLGLTRREAEIAALAASRFPADRELRQYLNGVLWRAGRIDDLARIADEIAGLHAGSADAQWHAGYAHLLAAEHERRIEAPDHAHDQYRAAETSFTRAMTLAPDYAADCRAMIALSWLGRGLAHAQAGARQPAADCLLDALRWSSDLAPLRDGLGYDVLDLVDRILEWRAAGPGDVDPQALLARLLAKAPGDPFLGLAIADALLREALRADGRNPVRAERETVDAGGRPIRMPMGLPDAEGDRYLAAALAVARAVKPFTVRSEDQWLLAQCDTVWAERNLERNRPDGVLDALAEAATLLCVEPPPAGADAQALRAAAARLRERLGPARPRLREGR